MRKSKIWEKFMFENKWINKSGKRELVCVSTLSYKYNSNPLGDPPGEVIFFQAQGRGGLFEREGLFNLANRTRRQSGQNKSELPAGD